MRGVLLVLAVFSLSALGELNLSSGIQPEDSPASTNPDPQNEAPPGRQLAPHLGHNVSGTSYLLPKWDCTIGIQVTGCGLSSKWMLATVPWLYMNYNMYSIVNRIRLYTFQDGSSWTAQVSYFKTFPEDFDSKYITFPYDMEAYWLQMIRSYFLARHYRMYLNVATNYYANDHRPFSLRRPIPGRNQGQLNITTLHEVALVNRFYTMFELGAVDLAQPSPYVHIGFSFGRSGFYYEWHLGMSITSTPLALFNPRSRRDYQQELRDTSEGFNQHLDREKTKRDYAIHPEFALQAFF
ncbi:MAG: hypothetical protein AB7F86_01685 [Bdellovibrionales bacterium]